MSAADARTDDGRVVLAETMVTDAHDTEPASIGVDAVIVPVTDSAVVAAAERPPGSSTSSTASK